MGIKMRNKTKRLPSMGHLKGRQSKRDRMEILYKLKKNIIFRGFDMVTSTSSLWFFNDKLEVPKEQYDKLKSLISKIDTWKTQLGYEQLR